MNEQFAEKFRCPKHLNNGCYLNPLSPNGREHLTRHQREVVALAERMLAKVEEQVRNKMERGRMSK